MGLKRRIEKLKDWACAKDCGMCPWCDEAEYGERFCPFDGVIKAAEERAREVGNNNGVSKTD